MFGQLPAQQTLVSKSPFSILKSSFWLVLWLFLIQSQPILAQCNPAALEIPGNGIDEDCDGIDDIYLAITPYIYTTVGQDFELYFRNCILSKHPNDYVFEVATPAGGVSSAQKWAFTPTLTQVGEIPFSIKVKTPSGLILATANSTIRVSPASFMASKPAQKVVLYGHSFYDQGYMPVYLENLTKLPGNPTVTFHGTKASWATPFTKHEGYGGYMWRWFIQSSASPFRFGNEFSLKKYFDNVCGGVGQRPDMVIINLDINDFCGYTALVGNTIQEIDDSITNDWNLNARRIIDSIRVAAPNCKIGICIAPPGNGLESAFAATYSGNPTLNNRWRWQKMTNRIAIKNIERYSNRENENIYLIPQYMDLDDLAEYNPVDARHPDPIDNNINTHCGYNEIAKSIYAWVKFAENTPTNGGGGTTSSNWYQDADLDGFGNLNIKITASTQPTGYVNNALDCNDANANISPAAAEICGNNLDDNCNGQIDESAQPTGYCASTSGAPWEDWIAGVKIGTTEKISSKTTYSDFTATVFPLAASNTITLTSGYSYSTFDEYFRVWIDLNRDGDFADAGEMVAEKIVTKPATGITSASATASFSMSYALCGTTRMRVSMTRTAYPTPCQSLVFGEVEDFMVSFSGGTPPVLLPDFTLQNVVTPAAATIGVAANINFSIRNIGTANVAGNVATAAYLSSDNVISANDLVLGSVTLPSPTTGTSTNGTLAFTLPTNLTAGNYSLILRTDDTFLATESDETNNLLSQNILVAIAPPVLFPDFTLQNLVAPTTLTLGAASPISFSVKNIGTGTVAGNVVTAAYLSTDNAWSINDLVLGTASIAVPAAGVSSGSTLNFTLPATVLVGNYSLILRTDDANLVVESDESNNILSQNILVAVAPPALFPDFTLQNLVAPTTLTLGAASPISFSVKNIGTGTVAGNVVTAAYLSTDNTWSINDLALGTASIAIPAASVSSGSTLTFTLPSTVLVGNYSLILRTDDANLVVESDETNNILSQNIAVIAPPTTLFPDLLVATLTAPTSVLKNTPTPISFSIKNNGTLATSQNVVTGIYLSIDNAWNSGDLLLGSTVLAMPAVGSSTLSNFNLSVPTTQVAGNFYLILRTDDGNFIVESNENNNLISQALTITDPVPTAADLQISTATIPTQVTVGVTTYVSFTLKNAGTAPVSSSFSTKLWLSVDPQVNSGDLLLGTFNQASLAAGVSANGTMAFSLPTSQLAGPYFFILTTDSENSVAESNETNNQFNQNATVINNGVVTYCASAGDFPWHDWISKVKIGALEYASDKSQYSNFTAVTPFKLLKNSTNQVRLSTSYSSEIFEEYWRIWVDFNKDGDFLDFGEQIFSQKMNLPAVGTTTATLISSISLASSTPTGSFRMRVSKKRGAVVPTSCELYPFGEVEDYSVLIFTNLSEANGRATNDDAGGSVNLQIAPNPSSGAFSVNLSEFAGNNAQINITNALGKPVLSRELVVPNQPIDFDLGAAQDGTYFIFVKMEGVRPICARFMLIK